MLKRRFKRYIWSPDDETLVFLGCLLFFILVAAFIGAWKYSVSPFNFLIGQIPGTPQAQELRIHKAILADDGGAIQAEANRGAHLDSNPQILGFEPYLFLAIKNQKVLAVRALLHSGADTNHGRPDLGTTPVAVAMREYMTASRHLRNAGSASAKQKADIAKMIMIEVLNAHGNPNTIVTVCMPGCSTSLYAASREIGDVELSQKLIEIGAQ